MNLNLKHILNLKHFFFCKNLVEIEINEEMKDRMDQNMFRRIQAKKRESASKESASKESASKESASKI
jgi:hypothetical protein